MSENTRVTALHAAIELAKISDAFTSAGVMDQTRQFHNFLLRGTMPAPLDVNGIDHPVLKRMVAVYDLVNNPNVNSHTDPVMFIRYPDAVESDTTEDWLDEGTWVIAGREIDEDGDSYDALSVWAARGLIASGVFALTMAPVDGDAAPVMGLAVRRGALGDGDAAPS